MNTINTVRDVFPEIVAHLQVNLPLGQATSTWVRNAEQRFPSTALEVTELGCLNKRILLIYPVEPMESDVELIVHNNQTYLALAPQGLDRSRIGVNADGVVCVLSLCELPSGPLFSDYSSMFWCLVAFDYCEYNNMLESQTTFRHMFKILDPSMAANSKHWLNLICNDMELGLM